MVILYAVSPWMGALRPIILGLDEALTCTGNPEKLWRAVRNAAMCGGVALSEMPPEQGAAYWREIGQHYEDRPRDPALFPR